MFKRLINDNFFKDSTMLITFSLFSAVINYVSQILAGRILSVENFGLLNAVISFMTILNVPGTAISLTVSKYTTVFIADNDRSKIMAMIRCFLLYITVFSICLLIIFVPMADYLGRLFNVENTLLLIMVMAMAIISYYQTVVTGYAHGARQFFIVSLMFFISTIFKLIGVLFASFISSDGDMQLWVILITMLASIVFRFVICTNVFSKANLKILKEKKQVFKSKLFLLIGTSETLISNLCSALMLNIDMLLIRRNFPNEVSGIYSSSMLFGHIIIFGTDPLMSALFTHAVKAKSQSQRALPVYLKSILYSLLIIVTVFIPVIFFPSIITILFGTRYATAMQYMSYSCLLSSLIALNNMNMKYGLAISKTKMIMPIQIVGCILCVLLGSYFKHSVESVLTSLLFVMLTIFGINLTYIIYHDAKEKKLGGI